MSSVTGNKSCVSNIAESNVLQYLLLVLYMLPSCQYTIEYHGYIIKYYVVLIILDCVMYTGSFVVVAHELVLEVFQALTSNTQIVKESIQKGTYMYKDVHCTH